MAIPAAPPATNQPPPIRASGIAPIVVGQRSLDVGGQRDGQTGADLVKRPGPLYLSRQSCIAFVAVYDRARCTVAGRGQIDQVESVVWAEPNVRDQKIEGPAKQPGPCGLEIAMTFEQGDRDRGPLEDAPSDVVGFDEQNPLPGPHFGWLEAYSVPNVGLFSRAAKKEELSGGCTVNGPLLSFQLPIDDDLCNSTYSRRCRAFRLLGRGITERRIDAGLDCVGAEHCLG